MSQNQEATERDWNIQWHKKQKLKYGNNNPCRREEIINLIKIRPQVGEGNGTPLQCSCLENPMDRGTWQASVHGVTKSQTRLSNFPFTFHFHALEKEMATHSSLLAWRIPGMEEPGGLPSMGSYRVGHDWRDLAAVAAVSWKGIPGMPVY